MKILLAACNAKYIHSNLAVYSLRAYAEEYARNIVLKEYTINQQKDDIMKDIYLEKPDVICVSCYIWNISFVKELMQDLKKILPDVPVWAGGPEVSFDAEEFLEENPAFDGVMVGEGEETFLELVRHYADKAQSAPQEKNPRRDAAEPGRDAAGVRSEAAEPGCAAAGVGSEAAEPGCAAAGVGSEAAEPGCAAAELGSEAAGPGCDAAGVGLEAAEPGCAAAGVRLEAAVPGCAAAGVGSEAAGPGRDAAGLDKIRGLVWRESGTVRHNGWREVLDLDSLPFVYKDLREFKNRIIYYESSRGCPFSCSYCLSSVEKKLRFRDVEMVKKELQFFLDNRVPQVKFVDRTFNCKHDHAMAIWEYIAEHDNGVTNFHFEISADLLREDELALMRTMRPGLIQLEIGVQSTNPATIREIRRTMDLGRLKETVNRVRSFGNIHQHLDLIAGLPCEDYDSFRQSFDEVYALKPQQLQLGFLKVLKGSHMKKMAAEYGIIHKEREPYEVLRTRWLSYDDVLKLKMVEDMVEVYYNSGQFENTLELMAPLFGDAFGMYEALGRFYERKGYDTISHSRMRRYEILLEFAREEGGAEDFWEKAADSMIYDLYLRENLKSRPAFGLDQKPWEKPVWEYRRRKGVPRTAHIEVLRDGRALLFDYENRDPLTNNANVKEISLRLL